MFLEFIRGIFTLANSFIAVFIVIYAFLFLKKTKSHYERRPWDYLFMASLTYLTYTLATMLLTLYNVDTILNLQLKELNVFFQFLYTGLILLAFISQTDLIFKNEIIVITRKLEPRQRSRIEEKIEKEIEKQIGEPKPVVEKEKPAEKEEAEEKEKPEKEKPKKEKPKKEKSKKRKRK